MSKVLVLMKRKNGMSYADFRKWVLDDHPEFAKAIPGMIGYSVNVPVQEIADAPYDAITEMWFESTATRDAGLGSDPGKAAGADAAAHCEHRFRFFAEERVVIS